MLSCSLLVGLVCLVELVSSADGSGSGAGGSRGVRGLLCVYSGSAVLRYAPELVVGKLSATPNCGVDSLAINCERNSFS